MRKLSLNIILASLLLVFSACKKQLNAPPPNAKVNGTAVVDLKSAQVTLNGVYYQFANASSTLYNWQVQNVMPSMLVGTLGYGAGPYPEEQNINLTSRFMTTANPWPRWYKTLAAANGFLEGLKALPSGIITPQRTAEMEAEARFLRAYSHFKLLMFFAEWKDLNSQNGVLLRNELPGISSSVKKRSTVAESYESILEDLDFAVANGPSTNPNHYMNKGAAMILQARVLLTRGQEADITKALSLANAVIALPNYSLENNVKDIFHVKGLSSSEVILGVKPQPLQETRRETNSGPYYGPGATYASTPYRAKGAFRDLLNGDPRQSWMVGEPNTNVNSPNTFVFSKFLPYVGGVQSVPTQLSEVSYAMRLSEAYLLKAEAIARSSGGNLTDAKNQIKTVMSKAGVTDFSAVDNAVTATDVWKQAYYETLRGFTGEDGIDWLALMRFPFDTIKELRPTITEMSQLWFGIPLDELQNNPLFGSQNAGGYPIP
jgi:hypothetical protein